MAFLSGKDVFTLPLSWQECSSTLWWPQWHESNAVHCTNSKNVWEKYDLSASGVTDRKVHPTTFQVFEGPAPPSQTFSLDSIQMGAWNKSDGFGKRSSWLITLFCCSQLALCKTNFKFHLMPIILLFSWRWWGLKSCETCLHYPGVKDIYRDSGSFITTEERYTGAFLKENRL